MIPVGLVMITGVLGARRFPAVAELAAARATAIPIRVIMIFEGCFMVV